MAFDHERLFAMTDGAHGGPVLWSYVDGIDRPNPGMPGYFDGSPLRVGDIVIIIRTAVDVGCLGSLRIVLRVRPQVVLGILGG